VLAAVLRLDEQVLIVEDLAAFPQRLVLAVLERDRTASGG
jgi:hypothetical protein